MLKRRKSCAHLHPLMLRAIILSKGTAQGTASPSSYAGKCDKLLLRMSVSTTFSQRTSCLAAQELAEKVVEVVSPLRDKLDAVLIFPSMPDVMRLNKVFQNMALWKVGHALVFTMLFLRYFV